MNDTINRFSFQENIDSNELIFKSVRDSLSQKFKYKISNKNYLELQGSFNGKELLIELKKVPETKFRLLNRGFHWVNESTYNY